ncbi:protein argonaute 16 [Cynara cardunculus var. scolymus]|uniref:protein argonaute 16 n=1 Tax=Cynara cardunculus var. scolymus TaxID=59895 RepID=UPI000D62ED8C|nr:protein argonaute 16 [Cynara cardunculus var. scolymus]
MEIVNGEGANGSPPIPLPPPQPEVIQPDVKIEQADHPKRCMISRTGFGSSGKHISLLANHFKVSVKNPEEIFYQYSVSISSEDNRAIESKGLGRKILDKLYQTYSSELSGKRFAYDGEKSLYTVGPLPRNKYEFMVVLEYSFGKSGSPSHDGILSESGKRSRRSFQEKTYKVEISYAAKIPLKSVCLALQGSETEKLQDALRVLDIILRQQAAQRGCLLVRQSFFLDDSRNFTDVGGGVTGCRGFHSSFRPTHGGLSLNMDVSTTMILTPGPVIDFLKSNQNARDARSIDWVKAKKMLKNMRIKTRHSNREFKITGMSEKPCNQQLFSLRVKKDDGTYEDQTINITVLDYFTKHRNIELTYSAYIPCIDVGKPKKPSYLPVELCSLVSLQRYTKALSTLQRASLVEKSRQKPQEKMRVINDAMKNYHYDDDPLLASCGICIEKQFAQVDGRVLEAPKLKVGNGEEFFPRNGRWNFNNKKVFTPTKIEKWAVVNFSARCDASHLSRELINCGRNKGILIDRPFSLMEEDQHNRRCGPVVRVEKMFDHILAKLPGAPEFLLCILPERKNSDIYGPWKKKCLSDYGVPTQCMCPVKITDQYLTNVLLKINSKLGGINSLLALEQPSRIPLIHDTPTMIIGMDVSHGSPGRSDIPSIAAVVGSHSWPLISRYKASVRTQSSKVEMIEGLFKPQADGTDDGIMSELLVEFYQTSNHRKPTQIIVFRDGVSESQFNQVLNIELDQMIKAYQHLGEVDVPKFTVIVAQKNHHTKLFQASGPENVPAGTVVDSNVVHPRNYDFYMCAQSGMIGTSRPAHYHVLLDEIGFSPDNLQNLILTLSYVYQRSSAATSIVAPISYAHLAAQQMGQFLKFEDLPENTYGKDSLTSVGPVPVPELPKLHEDVQGSMFFC